MRKIQRLAAVGALAGLTVALGACTSEEEPAAGGGSPSASEPAETQEETSAAAPAGGGVTTVEDIFGPGCSAVPTEGEGSPQGMVDDPVATAASNNPIFTTLVQTVSAANLVDTLNDPNAQFTVFGPTNDAFAALEESQPGITEELLAEPEGTLTTVLTYHVIPQRYDAQGLVDAGTVTSVQGGEVTITGTPEAPIINDDVNVVCGNVPTANATVFAIDQVLMPPAA